MSANDLIVATCQFPVSGDVDGNAECIRAMIRKASRHGAHIVHFCETALTGYAGSCPQYDVPVFDLPEFDGYDWTKLETRTLEIASLAKTCNIWVILGTTSRPGGSGKPRNSLCVFSNRGRLVDRYDKRRCTKGDLLAYSPGKNPVTFRVNGVICGLLICADMMRPDFYSAYRAQGVQVLIHAFYNARFRGPIPNDRTVIPANRDSARKFGLWIYASNSSARHSCWPAHLAGPDGSFKKLRRHAASILYHQLTPAMLR